MKYDAVILGAGCAGQSIAWTLAKRGLRIALIDSTEEPSFSSVRNQGWLHSGFLYTGHGLSEVALECSSAAAELRATLQHFGSSRLVGEEKGLALFADQSRATSWVKNAREIGIAARILNGAEVAETLGDLVLSPRHSFAVEIDDTTVDNAGFLNFLQDRCVESGVEVRIFRDLLDQVSIVRDSVSSNWQIDLHTEVLSTSKVLICLGPATPEFVGRVFGVEENFRIKNCLVQFLNCRLVDRLIISPNPETGYTNLSPCSSGLTVNSGAEDAVRRSYRENEDDPDQTSTLHMRIRSLWPQLLEENSLLTETYLCQKLEYGSLMDRSQRQFRWSEITQDVVCFYPGKFTFSLRAAAALSNSLEFEDRPNFFDFSLDRTTQNKGLGFVHPGVRFVNARP